MQFDPALKDLLLRRVALGPPPPDGAEQAVPVLARVAEPDRAIDGLRVVAVLGEIVTGRVAPDDLEAVRRHPRVRSLKLGRRVHPADASSLERPDQAFDLRSPTEAGGDRQRQRPRGAPRRPTGAGVVVAVLDWGLDPAHVNFRAADGCTRLLAVWDQRGGRTATSPEPFGYGKVLEREAIDAALRRPDPYADLGYDPADADPRRTGAHGTHVADIAAGSGRAAGSLTGLAPGADLLFVHLRGADTGPEDTLGDSVRLVEALAWVADRVGDRPVVVNLSLGATGGPHDASLLVVRALDAFCEERDGRVVVMSCGNYREAGLHAEGVIATGQTVDLPWSVEPTPETAELEVWYPGADELEVTVLHPDGRVLAHVPLGGEAALCREGRWQGSAHHRRSDPNNGDHQIDVFLWPLRDPGVWTLRLSGRSVVQGHWHAWIERASARWQSRFPGTVASPWSTTNTICNGRLTLAVGSCRGRPGEVALSGFSSCGPTRDLRVKPDLVAPGEDVLAARSSAPGPGGRRLDQVTVMTGTSMAAPHVAGSAALLLAAAPVPLSATEVRGLLQRSARRPPPVDVGELLRTGSGLVDVDAALALLRTSSG